MSRLSLAALALGAFAMCGTAHAQAPARSPTSQRPGALPRVVPNDNRVTAGKQRQGIHEVRLVAAFARWHPNGERDSSVVVPSLAEEGQAPRIPAPLVRVAAGTRLRFVVRNALDDSLQLCVRGGSPCSSDPLWILPGETRTLETVAADTGLFAWYGALRRVVHGERLLVRPQMTGALVVDGASPKPDRIIVLNGWGMPSPDGNPFAERFFITLNGRLWPHTERLRHTVGDTVRWRLLNGTRDFHPMHLHGFYFRVLSGGDGRTHRPNAPGAQPLVVTENLPALGTATVEWVPDRAGNWLFHCHKALHVSPGRRADLRGEKAAPPGPLLLAGPPVGQHEHGTAKEVNHALDMMSGMVIGIEVRPRAGAVATPDERPRRDVRVLAQRRPGAFGAHAALGFALQSGDAEPSADSLVTPARPIVLVRGEPVSITVVNRLGEHTGVHWHGIELESFFDGVPGWSGGIGGGDPRSLVSPMIAPSDSFVARFTPPRAGTFMFHAHADEMRQLASGLVGALVVLEPGQQWNRETDHLFVISQAGPSDTASIVVNGRASHMTANLKAGAKHRVRVVSIAPQDDVGLLLIGPQGILKWRALAKDGADLPPALAVEESAFRRFGPGETFDFELELARGEEKQLVVRSFTNVMITLMGQ